MEWYALCLRSFYKAIPAGSPTLKTVIAEMDVLNHILNSISIGYSGFHGDCKDGRVKFFLKPYFK